jgi:hypothetical protein
MAKPGKPRTAGPRATSAHYDVTARRIVLELASGYSFGIPLDRLPELKGASPDELSSIEVIGAGNILHWESLDADYSVPALVVQSLGLEAFARELARRGGSATSDAKSAAARANGAKGGRPRKSTVVVAREPSASNAGRLWSKMKTKGPGRATLVPTGVTQRSVKRTSRKRRDD